MIGLTPNQKRLLDFIVKFQSLAGISPNFDEMADAMNLSSKSGIHRILVQLEEKKYIRRLYGRARAIEILRADDRCTIDKALDELAIIETFTADQISRLVSIANYAIKNRKRGEA